MSNTCRYIINNMGARINRTAWANSWATIFVCLLMNSIWEFWNLSSNSCLQAPIVHLNSLLSSTLELTQSTTLLQSSTKSTLSNCWLEIQSKVVCNPTASPTSTSQRGTNHFVLARTNALSSSLIHIPSPTMLWEEEKDASMLHLFLPGVGFFQRSSSRLMVHTCGVVFWLLLRDLMSWDALHSYSKWFARWSTCTLVSFCCCQSFMFRLFQRLHIIVAISSQCPEEKSSKKLNMREWIL